MITLKLATYSQKEADELARLLESMQPELHKNCLPNRDCPNCPHSSPLYGHCTSHNVRRRIRSHSLTVNQTNHSTMDCTSIASCGKKLWKLSITPAPYSIQKYRLNVHNLFTIYPLQNLTKYDTI